MLPQVSNLRFNDTRSIYSDVVAVKQSQVDKLYAGLKDLARERRAKLDEALQLFALHREIADLEQWITEKEVVASSQDLGQDYDHVTVSKLLMKINYITLWLSHFCFPIRVFHFSSYYGNASNSLLAVSYTHLTLPTIYSV